MAKFFISYRRSDSEQQTFLLYDTLCSVFGKENLFIDKEMLPLGHYFPEFLYQVIDHVDAILVVIGSTWDTVCDTKGNKRLEDRFDYVRIEVEKALFRNQFGVPVIPITLPGVLLSKLEVPDAIATIQKLQAYEIIAMNQLEDLIQRLQKINAKQTGALPKPVYASQALNPYQFNCQYEGFLKKLPKDAVLFLHPTPIGWEFHIECASKPQENRSRDALDSSIMNGMEVYEAVSVLMEWYAIPFEQCIVKKRNYEPQKTSIMKRFFTKNRKHKETWQRYYGKAIYTSLHRLVITFDQLIEAPGICDTYPHEYGAIPMNYNILGVLEDPEQRTFGKYVCSITQNLGGQEQVTGKLYYLPTISETKLQYIDLKQQPYLLGIKICGHIGMDAKGFHLMFV